jgi:hypothetical protein
MNPVCVGSRPRSLLQIWRQTADGSGEPELLVDSGACPVVTPDGTHLIYCVEASPGDNDIMRMTVDGSRRI